MYVKVELMNGNAMEEDETSRPSTPSSEASFRDLVMDTNVEQRTRVKELACAVLQLEQSVDPKYLKRPLGKLKLSFPLTCMRITTRLP